MEVYRPVYPGLYYFDTFTFTTLGTSGHRGPDSTKTYANAPWSADQFSIVNGQQQWTVPATGTYHVEAAGAYGVTPGRVVSGDVNLNEGQTLTMLVGQQPNPLVANVADATTVGGGGGTFIGSNGKLLMTASGGDGTGGSAASFSPYGTGNGKNGGGYLSNGLATNATFKFLTPAAYINGGFGNSFPTGVVPEEGGFGGGQSPVTSGISGGGGYTGSPGDGVSGATCYADPAVRNFTDLGAASNTAGYVTVSLTNPSPLKKTWSWDPTQTWSITNAIASGLSAPVWASSLGLFIVSANFQKILSSPDGVVWSTIQNNLPALSYYYSAYGLVASTTGILLAVSSDTGYVYRSTDASTWTLSLSYSINRSYSVFINNLFILRGNDNTTVYTSPDGTTWTTITPNVIYDSITYGNSNYVMSRNGTMYTSVGLVTWTPVLDSNVATSTNGWGSVLYDSQTFIALRLPFISQIRFQTNDTNMSPRPQQMINNPIYNITSLTFTGGWQQAQAKVGDTLTFASISGFVYTISPATYGTVTAADSGSVTISIVSSTISISGSGGNNINLPFVQNGTTYTIVTSSDGTNWYGRTTPSSSWGSLLSGGGSFVAINYYTGVEMYSLDKGVTWKLSAGTKGATSGAYSPSLKYFLFTNGQIFYVSLDGSLIVQTVSGGTVGNPLQLTWADTLGILVAVSAYSIITSSDGNTWTLALNLKPDGSGSDSTRATVSWSRELGLLVAYFRNSNTSNSPLLYTSTDGITWSQTVLSSAFTQLNSSTNPCKPCWSNQLGLFTIGESVSRDGINWVLGSGLPGPSGTSLNNYTVYGGRANYSTYGINGVKAVNVTLNNTVFFDNTTQVSPYYPYYFASSSYDTLVMLGRPGDVLTFTANVFTTPSYYVQAWVGYTPGGGGTPWVTIGTQTGFSTGFRNVTFTYTIPSNTTAGNYALAFSCMSEQLTYASSLSVTALGNINEYSFQVVVTTATQFSPPLSCATWSPDLKLFVGASTSSAYYSTNGVLWSVSGSSVMTSIAWSPSLKLFVGVGEQAYAQSPFLIYTSSTGTSWTQVYSDVASSTQGWGGSVAWSPELNVFVCAYQSNSGVRMFTSSNGISWTSRGSNIIQAFSNGDLIWAADLKIFLFTTQRTQAGMLKSLPATKTF